MAFNDFDIGKFFSRITTAPGTGGLEAEEQKRMAAAEEALNMQREAKMRADLAAIPAADKESTRTAGEAQLRKLLRASGFNFSGSPLGAAPLGFSTLFGGG